MTDREHIVCLWLFLLGAAIGFVAITMLYSPAAVEGL